MKLFNTTKDLQLFIPVSQFSIDNLQDDLSIAYSDYVLKYVPNEQIPACIQDAENTYYAELLLRVKRATANIAFMLHFAFTKVNVSDIGVTNNGNDQNQKQASAEDKEDLYKATTAKAYAALESIVSYLYENQSRFTIWKQSEQYISFNSLLVRTTKELKLSNSYLVLLGLFPYIESAEIEIVDRNVDTDIMIYLREALTQNTLTPMQKVLLSKYMQPAISFLAMAYAASANAVGQDSKGNPSVYLDDGEYTRSRRDVEKQKIASWVITLKELSSKRFSLMQKFIEDNFEELGGTIVSNDILETFPFLKNKDTWSTTFH